MKVPSIPSGPSGRLRWRSQVPHFLLYLESLKMSLFPDSRRRVFLRPDPVNSITDQQDSVTQLPTTKHSLAFISAAVQCSESPAGF